MTRRDLIKLLLSSAIAQTVDVEKLLWVPGEKTIFIPSQAQIDFLNNTTRSLALYGIPYHGCNYTTGIWLGIPRVDVKGEIIKLIRVLEDDKKTEREK